MNKKTTKSAHIAVLTMVWSSLPLSTFAAETKESATTPATDSSVVTLERFEIKDVADEDQIMPTVRPISSVMGDARSVLDTPRSVSSISKELMAQVRIKSVTDFSQFSPGVYTAARYGLATTPMVRGDLAELYFDGQRAKYSRDSVMPSFNGVEALDIVKGPGSAVYGPQSNGASGYSNFVTKKPFFDKQSTEMSLSFGSLTADRDFSNFEWQIDTGGPLSDSTAYRLSYLGRDGRTYYQNTKDNTQDVFLSFAHVFDKTFTMNWWAQAYHQTYGEVSGINRPTQMLIDDSIYLAGTSVYNSATNTYTISKPWLVDLKAWKSVVGAADIAHADRFQTQLVLNKFLGSGAYVKNSTYFETRTSDKYEPGITYSEYVGTDWNVQNRTEYHASFESGNLSHGIIAGVDLKLERLISYQSFFGEEYNTQDLSQPSGLFSRPGTNIYLFGVPGDTKFGSDVGYGNYGGNQDSKIATAAAFIQDDVKITPKLSGIVGVRLDHIEADDKSPAFVDLGGYGSPGTLHPAGDIYDLGTSVNDTSYFLSSIYKISADSSVYVTYNKVNAVLGSANFGGVATSGKTDDDLKTALRSVSTLFEAGYKFVLFRNRLYNTVSAFRQLRSDPDRFGHLADRIAKGIEGESVFQLNKNLYVFGNVTYQDVFRNGGTVVFQSNADYYKLQPDGSYKSAGGGLTTVPYNRRYSGAPNWLASARLNYRFDSGFGIGVGPQFTGHQKANAEGTLTIPTQHKINLVLFYSKRTWDFQVNIDNLTNQHNWTVGDPDFTGNTVIYQEKPLTASFTTRFRF